MESMKRVFLLCDIPCYHKKVLEIASTFNNFYNMVHNMDMGSNNNYYNMV